MEIDVLRRISLARHLYGLAISYLKSSNDLYLFSTVNLMQDAVEAFLLAVADHVDAQLSEKTSFDKYFVEINKKIEPNELPFKTKLLRLNRIRVDSKHHGLQPAKDECERLSIATREFFDEVCNTIFNVNFSTVSTIDLLEDGEVKSTLLEAKNLLESGDHINCSITCRKVLYLEFESKYDIGMFKNGAKPRGLFGPHSRAPFYARNEHYIFEKVTEPTELIVIDYNDLDHELLKNGVDNTSYWNVWRLTPEVYRNEDGIWIIKNDYDKLEPDVLKDEIEYIFNTTVDIIFSLHSKRAASRTSSCRNYYLKLKNDEVPIYSKADMSSKITATTPKDIMKLESDYSIQGLKNDATYWHVSHFEKDNYYFGFIHNDYVES